MPLEVSDGQARLLAVLFPQLNDLELEQVEDTGATVRILARTRTQTAACRGCGTISARPHDQYRRRLHDLSCGGRPVVVELEVRRFRCDVPTCLVATFAEQVDGLTERYQRRSVGLRCLLERLALTAAGRAGSRLAHALGATVSRFTLLRLVRGLPDPPIGQVTVLGVDDFAKHKGHSYATVLLDMDDHRVVDVLPDREAGTFARWLIEHPGVQVICRDRAGAYAAGARQGAPDAQQVADRFHLWQSLGEAVEKTVITHRAALHEPEPEPAPDAGKATEQERAPSDDPAGTPATESALEPGAGSCALPEPDGVRDVFGRERRLVTRHRERYAAVHALLGEGHSLTEIGRRLGIGQDTVRRFARATSIEEVLFKATHRASILEEFKPYLNQRWNDGVTNAATLHAELRTRDWTGSVQAVRRYLS